MTKKIDGRRRAQKIKQDIRAEVSELEHAPVLAVIMVGDDPASLVYTRIKRKACREVGIEFRFIHLASAGRHLLVQQIDRLNKDQHIDGILLQLPLPSPLSAEDLMVLIDPDKDVDGLHPCNAGRLVTARATEELDNLFLPCTAKAVIRLLRDQVELAGREAVVVGRSNLVGKPAALLLQLYGATVTICHSRTRDLMRHTRQADVLVVAAGQPGLIDRPAVKEGAIVIDVGINKVGNKLVGDVDYASVRDKAGAITPVPGGVGPMTVACLLENVVQAYYQRRSQKTREIIAKK